jgi:ABC-type spermidine/putrescine transport system permease subunit II
VRSGLAKRIFTGWAVLVFLFLYLPIAVVVLFAFDKPSPSAIETFQGDNICDISPANIGNVSVWNGGTTCWFAKGFEDPVYVNSILTSLKVAAVVSVVSTALGLAAAIALARMRKRFRLPFDALVYLTLVVPEIVIAVASLIFFVQARNYFHLFPQLGMNTIIFGQVVFNASLAMLIIRARFVGMGDTLEEASYDLGSGRVSTFRQITLPRLLPAVIAAMLLTFTFSFDDYILPAFTNGTTQTWPIVLYSSVRFGITPAINALAAIMLVATFVVVIATAVLLRRTRVAQPRERKGLAAALGFG